MPECRYHESLEAKIDRLAETQAEMVGLLREAVVKKDEFYKEINNFHGRLNDVKDTNRRMVLTLSGVITLLGGALGVVLKTLS